MSIELIPTRALEERLAREEQERVAQHTIEFGPPPVPTRDDTIKYRSKWERKFWVFHERNPGAYRAFVRLAREGKTAGAVRLGIKQLFEIARWDHFIDGLPDTEEEFKLNNNYAPHYARLIMEKEDDLEGIFELRRLKK